VAHASSPLEIGQIFGPTFHDEYETMADVLFHAYRIRPHSLQVVCTSRCEPKVVPTFSLSI